MRCIWMRWCRLTLSQSKGSAWIVIPVLATLALLSGVVVYLATEKQ